MKALMLNFWLNHPGNSLIWNFITKNISKIREDTFIFLNLKKKIQKTEKMERIHMDCEKPILIFCRKVYVT